MPLYSNEHCQKWAYLRKGPKKSKNMVLDHNWGGGVWPKLHPYFKIHCFLKHIHLQLYSICSCTSIKVTFKTLDGMVAYGHLLLALRRAGMIYIYYSYNTTHIVRRHERNHCIMFPPVFCLLLFFIIVFPDLLSSPLLHHVFPDLLSSPLLHQISPISLFFHLKIFSSHICTNIHSYSPPFKCIMYCTIL